MWWLEDKTTGKGKEGKGKSTGKSKGRSEGKGKLNNAESSNWQEGWLVGESQSHREQDEEHADAWWETTDWQTRSSSRWWMTVGHQTPWEIEEPVGGLEINNTEGCYSKDPRRGSVQDRKWTDSLECGERFFMKEAKGQGSRAVERDWEPRLIEERYLGQHARTGATTGINADGVVCERLGCRSPEAEVWDQTGWQDLEGMAWDSRPTGVPVPEIDDEAQPGAAMAERRESRWQNKPRIRAESARQQEEGARVQGEVSSEGALLSSLAMVEVNAKTKERRTAIIPEQMEVIIVAPPEVPHDTGVCIEDLRRHRL